MFRWALFASYGALAALFDRGRDKAPLLITLADQKLGKIPWGTRFVLRFVLGNADQVYAMDTREAHAAMSLSKRMTLIHSIGKGDAFANQVRFVYANFLEKHIQSKKKK